MHHWLGLHDFEPAFLAELVTAAQRIKRGELDSTARHLRERILTMVFFNPSLRTRTSFEAGMLRFGGHAICLNVGGDMWKLESRDGVVMNGGAAEHVREAVPVLCRYGDALAVRTFAGMQDAAEDARDPVLRAFAEFATQPVINMESALEHPCQGLADWLTMTEKLGTTRGKRFVLSWAPHVKPLPMAVPHSAVLAAAAAGMQVTIAHPPGYELNPSIVDRASSWCNAAGTSLEVTNEQTPATSEANVVYVKSWGATGHYGRPDAQQAEFEKYADWTVRRAALGRDAILMHCLPVRRNIVIADDALDDPCSVVVDQAENRLWAQVAILGWLLQETASK